MLQGNLVSPDFLIYCAEELKIEDGNDHIYQNDEFIQNDSLDSLDEETKDIVNFSWSFFHDNVHVYP